MRKNKSSKKEKMDYLYSTQTTHKNNKSFKTHKSKHIIPSYQRAVQQTTEYTGSTK
jgi:hypothetical protein